MITELDTCLDDSGADDSDGLVCSHGAVLALALSPFAACDVLLPEVGILLLNLNSSVEGSTSVLNPSPSVRVLVGITPSGISGGELEWAELCTWCFKSFGEERDLGLPCRAATPWAEESLCVDTEVDVCVETARELDGSGCMGTSTARSPALLRTE
jgi:hypothetical protein